MSQSITLWNASYSDVPAVLLPKTGGGTARFDDCSVVTAQAADVTSGKIFVASDGTVTTGTNQGGSSGMKIDTASVTIGSASSGITFENVKGQPLIFAVISKDNIATGSSPRPATVIWDGSSFWGQIITNTSNAQVTYVGSGEFNAVYGDGSLAVYSNNYQFQAGDYELMYAYDGNSSNIGTADVQVGSGATSITFTGLTEEPSCWVCAFKSNFGTSSGYTRTIAVVNDGNSIYGMEMGSGAQATSNWSASYSNGSLTITSQGTNAGGYFHQPGYYQLTYGIGGEVEPPTIEALTVTQNGTYQESGKAYSPVTVNVQGGGSWNVAQTTWSNSSTSTVSHQFTGLLGTPKAAILRCTSQLTRSSSNTYYYIADIIWDGTNAWGNYHLRSNGTFNDVAKNAASGFNVSVGTNSITFSSDSSNRSSAPGAFFNGTYELTYWY